VGKSNRSRRTANRKQDADRRRAQRRAKAGHGAGRPSASVEAQQLVFAAIEHLDCDEHEDCRTLGERALAELSEQRGEDWARAVDGVLFALHLNVLENRCWPYGWQPADLARVAARELGAAARRCAIDLMAAQLRSYAPATVDQVWHDQLAELDARVWWPADADYVKEMTSRRGLARADAVGLLVRLLGLFAGLPRLETLTALPGRAHSATSGARGEAQGRTASAVDAKLLARVRALLAKAESTTFEAEAETFTAAAQAMMARHSIDEAMLHRHEEGREDDRPGGVRLTVENPYPEPKAMLLQQIAEANRCRAVWSKHMGFSTVLGFRADTAWVELLYTSLLVQATTAMAKAGTKTTARGTSRTRAFRAAFLESFALRIGERLRQATRQAETEAAESSGPDLLPVLADRGKAVDDEVHRIFPELTNGYRGSWSATDREGWSAGRAAADLADLAHAKAVNAPGDS
jgi:hypothetical protein